MSTKPCVCLKKGGTLMETCWTESSEPRSPSTLSSLWWKQGRKDRSTGEGWREKNVSLSNCLCLHGVIMWITSGSPIQQRAKWKTVKRVLTYIWYNLQCMQYAWKTDEELYVRTSCTLKHLWFGGRQEQSRCRL